MTDTIHDSETKAVGQQVITACAFIHKNFDGIQKVFLPKRSKNRKFLPDVFEVPGGHIEFGEDIKEGLIREIKEETQKDINLGDAFYVFTYTNEVKGSHSIEVIYFATFKDEGQEIKLDPEKHSEYGWFAESELDKIFTEIKDKDDPEIEGIKKGFSLLKVSTLNFGTK